MPPKMCATLWGPAFELSLAGTNSSVGLYFGLVQHTRVQPERRNALFKAQSKGRKQLGRALDHLVEGLRCHNRGQPAARVCLDYKRRLGANREALDRLDGELLALQLGVTLHLVVALHSFQEVEAAL